jgi:hypothetical protein
MTKVVNGVVQGQKLKQNPQYKQRSRTIYAKKRKLCMCYV